MTKEGLLEYYQTELIEALKVNANYKKLSDKQDKENEELAKSKGLKNRWQLDWNEEVNYTSDIKKYPKAKIHRLRILIQELMLEIEREL